MDLRDALNIPWTGEYPHPTLVMGIVNVTPDSFQTQGRHPNAERAVEHALRLVDEGADILDIGGETTKPGAETVPMEEEIRRVAPVVEALARRVAVPISVDTRKAGVARAALAAGARIVNDVSAGRFDPAMFDVVAEAGAFLCLMHGPVDVRAMRWSTQEESGQRDVVKTVAAFLRERADAAQTAGVLRDRIWIDPGFGFGKTVAENLLLLKRLDALVSMGYPVLAGTSRKSTLGRVLDDVPPEERVYATLATVALAAAAGAAIVRVHDVAAAVQVARTADAITHLS